MMEEQLSLAAGDKSKAVAEVEQRMTTKIIKQQVRNFSYCCCIWEDLYIFTQLYYCGHHPFYCL